MDSVEFTHADRNDVPVLFSAFCFWSFILIGRPQDILPLLAPLRLALSFCILTVVILFAAHSSLLNRIDFSNRQIKRFSLLFLMMILSIPLAYYRKAAFMFVFTAYTANVIFYFLLFILVDSPKKIKSFLFICCLSTLVYSAFSIESGIIIGNRLFSSQMFDPNDLAFFIISFLPFNFLFINSNEPILKRVVAFLSLGVGLIVVLRTGSRGGAVALGIMVLVMLFRQARTIPRSYKVLFLVLLSAVILAKIDSIDFSRYSTLLEPTRDYNLTDEFGRKEIWIRGLKLMLTHPATGVGVGCFNQALAEQREKSGSLPRWQTAHNSWILIGTETGVIGFVLFGLLNLGALKTFINVGRKEGTNELGRIGEVALLGFAGHFTGAMFLSQAYSIYWTFYIALSAVLYQLAKNVEMNSECSESSVYEEWTRNDDGKVSVSGGSAGGLQL